MRTNLPGLCIALVLFGCHAKQASVGKFYSGLSFKDERHFSHSIMQDAHALVKIVNDSYGYYSWKTIKHNFVLSNQRQLLHPDRTKGADTSIVSIYRTITNAELLTFKNDQQSYIAKEGNVLRNNLYFIDDHRCIYLSFDDDRSVGDARNIIPLYFDREAYPIPKKSQKRFEQYLRGYYTINGSDLFIHFENAFSPAANYFVNAKITERGITFLSMTVPNSPNTLYEAGYNANQIQFSRVLHDIAQPEFELVRPVKDVIYPPQCYISTGFELLDGRKERNPLHDALLAKYPGDVTPNDTLVITAVNYTYDFENEDHARTYTLKKWKGSLMNYSITERIGLNPLQDSSTITTW
ncbi:hypothetical protein [Parapedobacter sp. 2B3]|uniref:hypothetical protein n=1 Tax=Parapedobacter sp. 2B3 TaxID=3342381 RepID=UPI0035B57EC0